MSYINRYHRFINALKGQDIAGSIEMHHIVPRSMGGTDDKSNLIALTPRQHYLAHWMLWKAYSGTMAHAFFFMNNSIRYKRIGSKAYEQLRVEALTQMSKKRTEYMAKPEARENLRKHRANQVIPAEAYERQAKVISSLVWMNDGTRSYRVRPELVAQKLSENLAYGRLTQYINEGYKKMRSQFATNQWQAMKSAGHTGHLKRI
jgi:hypothetical protein